jgi:hypothetical protein
MPGDTRDARDRGSGIKAALPKRVEWFLEERHHLGFDPNRTAYELRSLVDHDGSGVMHRALRRFRPLESPR